MHRSNANLAPDQDKLIDQSQPEPVALTEDGESSKADGLRPVKV